MKVSQSASLACAALLVVLASVPATAQPTQVSYQGHLEKDGSLYTGTANFKFVIVSDGSTIWSNDGTSVGGSQPSASVAVAVNEGLFSVLLGAAPMVPMSAQDLSLAENPVLRVWVDSGSGFEQLADQPIASSAYALQSEGARQAFGDFVVSGEVQTGVGVRFPDNSLQTTAGGSGPDGDWVISGINMYSGVSGFVGINTSTPARTLQVNGQARSNDWELGTGSASSVGHMYIDTGGNLDLGGPGGVGVDPGLVLRGGLINGGGQVLAYNGAGQVTTELDGDSGGGSLLQLSDGTASTIVLDGKDGTDGGSLVQLSDGSASTIMLDGKDGTNGGSLVQLGDGTASTIMLDGKEGAGGGSLVQLGDGTAYTIVLDGKDGTGGGLATFTNTAHGMTVRLRGQAFGGGSQLELFGADGTLAHQWTAHNREWKVFSPTGTLKLWLIGDDGSGRSRIRTDIVEITGGADLSERFDLAPDAASVAPGTVVSIDPDNPGRLMTSDHSYDVTVVGVVSGAGGVGAGLVMGHQGTSADGDVPVALTGRVWTLCEASHEPIRPGDFLTTSERAGYAMRVDDPDRARGAILGKAMTALKEGTGLVLVLVSLQ